MNAIKRLFVIIILLPAGYVAFVLSPFLELKRRKNNDNSK